MIEQLKKLFPSLQYYETIPNKLDNRFVWYVTNNSHVISIDPKELDSKNEQLLNLFLIPFEHLFPPKSKEELIWEMYLQETEINTDIISKYRLVYFSIESNHIKPVDFKEAVNQIFEKETIILWENEREGILVDIMKDHEEESISYKEIIDILITDLYGNIKFFIGPYRENLIGIKQHYEFVKKGATIALPIAEENVVSYLDGIPIILMNHADYQYKNEIQKMILQDFLNDREFLNMIKVLFDSNLNISVAAKRLYMHRNSLQYRIEKFHEKTKLDIRGFHHALIVYLAILAKNE
ncbi:PucR family transcriptional regulator [Ornithinibacillus bavariensis]|uniref:PucR C-terminal helix-turn-helix domain-containing protein n=1 Tax=Ornithinibacillus bavariensis TaxID=545502 RepID=A0A919X520_9BACI|nr:helix-turn-helix domain-containing protein [Ornithinibacillus bavariensis]GIO25666.1 hypothetical protein J43TS3_02770 [Ornithinibacillus bavariensis]